MSDNKITNRILRQSYFGDAEEDMKYKAWREDRTGKMMHIRFVMGDGSSEFINYLQHFDMQLDADNCRLIIDFENAGKQVTIEGRGLDRLAEDITQRRVKSIHQHDQALHGNIGNGEDVVTGIRIEESSSS